MGENELIVKLIRFVEVTGKENLENIDRSKQNNMKLGHLVASENFVCQIMLSSCVLLWNNLCKFDASVHI